MENIKQINLIFVSIKLEITPEPLNKIWKIVFLFFGLTSITYAQSDSTIAYRLTSGQVVRAMVVDGDTFPIISLRTFNVVAKRPVKNKKYSRKYRKLRRDVKRAYPYAKLAGMKLMDYDIELKKLKNDRQRKKFMKRVEKELRSEFQDDVTKLTIRQGIILIKLIDRETGDTSYELVKQFRGSFSAFFWQSVARLFGHNLKLRYDPFGEDKMIEEIVRLIEKGEI